MGKINENVINALPKILRRLSNKEALCLEHLSNEFNVPISTLRENINKYIISSFPDNISFSKYTNSWISDKDFLSETLLSPEEIITMKILENNISQYGIGFEKKAKLLFNRFKRRASLQIYKKTNFEQITRESESIFAMIKHAIKNKDILSCTYNRKDRIIYPLKIVMFDGYWYVLIYQENEKIIKTFHLKSILNIENENRKYELNTDSINKKLDSAINAHFKDKDLILVQLDIHEKVIKYFERRPLSKNQILLPSTQKNYKKMEIYITDYMEIIPTIQQYIPYIKVISPEKLVIQIEKQNKDYYEYDLSDY